MLDGLRLDADEVAAIREAAAVLLAACERADRSAA
jgi:hypothetical protein